MNKSDCSLRLERDKVGGLKPGVPENMSEQALELMRVFESLVTWPPSRGETAESWLFDLLHPTALDAHLTTFIARMLDIGRDSIIPEKLKTYADRAMQTKEWNSVMQGRKTMVVKKECCSLPQYGRQYSPLLDHWNLRIFEIA